ncbi:hypothetical protein ABH935_003675 [Catenulispora sp. GAS73]|uniref:hypothetical protein n=1 Tax=Catenulispora sp. GAS73 TaxID=3156269 RepID=UPI003511D2C6
MLRISAEAEWVTCGDVRPRCRSVVVPPQRAGHRPAGVAGRILGAAVYTVSLAAVISGFVDRFGALILRRRLAGDARALQAALAVDRRPEALRAAREGRAYGGAAGAAVDEAGG